MFYLDGPCIANVADMNSKFLQKDGISMVEVNKMSFQQFVKTFGSVIEWTPLAAARVWECRPFNSLKELHQKFSKFIQETLNDEAKISLIRCYADLSGKLTENLSCESILERKAAGLFDLTVAESRQLYELNERYKKRFRFPFVICSKDNNKQTILEQINVRMQNDRATEVIHALNEIIKIAWYRLISIVSHNTLILFLICN